MILLTGATGFLGKFVLDELMNQGMETIALSRREERIQKAYPNVKWLIHDLCDGAIQQILPRHSGGIIHLACTLSVQPDMVIGVDLQGMCNLLKIWDGGYFVFSSSTDVYGHLKRTPANEDHPLIPYNWYGFGKMICEKQLHMIQQHKQIARSVIFRSPYILGAHPKFRSSLVGNLISIAREGMDFILPKTHRSGAGSFGSSWVCARDLARCIVQAVRGGPHGIYNVASGFFSWQQLIEKIITKTKGVGQIRFQENGKKIQTLCEEKRLFSTEKLRKVYSIDKNTSIDEILTEILDLI